MRVGRHPGGAWYGEDRRRLRFERGARDHFPDLRGMLTHAGRRYRITLPVPHHGVRRVEVLFRKSSPNWPRVTVDGPTESPHRYASGHLCIWDPRGPHEEQWAVEDGLLVLLGLIIAHLFREAWWRKTGEWLGPQTTHTSPDNGRMAA